MQKFWSFSYDLPNPILDFIPLYLRRRWVEDRWMWAVERQWGVVYEEHVMNFMRRVHGDLFVDVGANVGVYSIKLQHNFARIIAIEADPAVYSRLQETCPPNCEAINLAVSNIAEAVSFYAVNNLVGWVNLGQGSMFPSEPAQSGKGLKIRAAPLSSILADEEKIDLVKVDVEGAEWLVLEGAELIMPRIRRWVVELQEPSRWAELEGLMRRYGYTENVWLDSAHLASQRDS